MSVMNTGHMVLSSGKYKKCIDVWNRSLDFLKGAHITDIMNSTDELLYVVHVFYTCIQRDSYHQCFLTSRNGTQKSNIR